MWERIRKTVQLGKRQGLRASTSPAAAGRRRPLVEILEGRQLLTASLGALSNLSVPAQQGYQLPLDGSGNTDGTQTYTVTSDNPLVKVSVAQGPYWTLNVSHQAASSSDISFSGALVFQLFADLTPNTVTQISNFTNTGFYNGKNFARIMNNFPGTTDYIAQGGSVNPDGSGTSPFANFADELVQSIAFTGTGQLAMANSGVGTNTNNTQFFVTTGTPTFLDYNHTIFGQLVAGSNILGQMTQVQKSYNTVYNETSLPTNPVLINSATLSSSNVNGVVHIDTTSATAGQSANISVTATDPTDGSTRTETFRVTVGAYQGPTSPVINFIPLVSNVATSTNGNSPVLVTLAGKSGYPNTSTPATLAYAIATQPAHGTLSNLNASAGTVVYTPNPGYTGPDTFQYNVSSTGPKSSPVRQTSVNATVTVNVGQAIVNTGAVRQVADVLIIQAQPRATGGGNTIRILQQPDPTSTTGGEKIVVLVNGQVDQLQPSTDSLVQIMASGTKANTSITVDPNVTVPVTLNGGHGRKNRVQAGGSGAILHGWYGRTTLIAGDGINEMVGRKGHVRFKATSATVLAYASNANPNLSNFLPTPSGGTYYRFIRGRLVAVKSN
ncbi:putative peptidyl-prolyl cis-trans isomerase [Aquisphaera giovannonii]|uniref:peptidylprolyl isomerase n=1 Tax=Aquisphaera giovannonii TaxID=406548 RepID=A0A5B9WBA3_9BACT|nr:peptidylprolyl isomerase [Aquisphaera giovannonii]QEH37876.1 putative peptidyl-prolyl cis-trans isomerase [Aquisphaera giovannonii]